MHTDLSPLNPVRLSNITEPQPDVQLPVADDNT